MVALLLDRNPAAAAPLCEGVHRRATKETHTAISERRALSSSTCLHESRQSFNPGAEQMQGDAARIWSTNDMYRNEGAQRYAGREGAYETHVRAQSSSTPLCRCLNVMITKWHWLIQNARNPYRPEHHYMRGPGPKWHAKHQGCTENRRFDGAAL